MKLFNLPIGTLILRFYLMMAVVLIAGFSRVWLLALLALPIFLSALLGVQFGRAALRDVRKTAMDHAPQVTKHIHHPA